jgi:hypothetical protein
MRQPWWKMFPSRWCGRKMKMWVGGIRGLTKVPGVPNALPSLVASVAQLVEQLTLNQLVPGSSPGRGTRELFKMENGPGSGDVCLHLGAERVKGGKSVLVADTLLKGDLQFKAIQVAGKIKEMHFKLKVRC